MEMSSTDQDIAPETAAIQATSDSGESLVGIVDSIDLSGINPDYVGPEGQTRSGSEGDDDDEEYSKVGGLPRSFTYKTNAPSKPFDTYDDSVEINDEDIICEEQDECYDDEIESQLPFPTNEERWIDDDDTGYILANISTDKFDKIRSLLFTADVPTYIRKSGISWHRAFELLAEERKENDMADGYYEVGQIIKNLCDYKDSYNSDDEEDDFRGVYNSFSSPRRDGLIYGQEPFRSMPRGSKGYSYTSFNLKVVVDPYRTGFEASKEFQATSNTLIAGRYLVDAHLGGAAFSNAYMCEDIMLRGEANHPDSWVCLKVIKNNKDYFDQSLDEIKLLQYINHNGDADRHNVVKMLDFFYFKEHLIIVSELLKENLYDFGTHVRDNKMEPYFTLLRLKKIARQILDALDYIHSLDLIHCDVKPENIVIKSYSRCEVKLIDFGSSCFTTDPMSTYIQSRSYRAPEVILGHDYDGRIDIWSLGAVIAEMYTGYVLFQNDSVQTMLCRIAGIMGKFPDSMVKRSRDYYKYFLPDGTAFQRVDDENYQLIYPKVTTLAERLHVEGCAEDSDEMLFLDFVSKLLNVNPYQRLPAKVAINHPWLAGVLDIDFASLNSIYTAVGQAQLQKMEQSQSNQKQMHFTNIHGEDMDQDDCNEIYDGNVEDYDGIEECSYEDVEDEGSCEDDGYASATDDRCSQDLELMEHDHSVGEVDGESLGGNGDGEDKDREMTQQDEDE